MLAELAGEPLVLHAARRIVELDPGRKVAVCTEGGAVAGLLAPLGFEIIYNPAPEGGLSTSLACGIASLKQGAFSAALVSLGDMPFVTLAHLHRLAARFDPVDAPIVASVTDGVALPPAMFACAYFDRLRMLEGDSGARVLLASAAHVAARSDELTDIDTLKDMDAVSRRGGAPIKS
ncbi:MAG: hypothetical protein JWL66_1758 [Sphingomonadales bacterium]|nr:hypothetical protein [Sphingomonadales bacterium]